MTEYVVSHERLLRDAALGWLAAENGYQWRKFNQGFNLASLSCGLGDVWLSEFGNYPQRAAVFSAEPKGRLQALQAAGKLAATGRALFASLLQFSQPDVSIEAASRQTFDDLGRSLPPASRSSFNYVGKAASECTQQSPLSRAVYVLDAALPRPVVPGEVPDEVVAHARDVCLEGMQLFIDYLVELCPPGQAVVLPRGGLPSGTIRPWQPFVF